MIYAAIILTLLLGFWIGYLIGNSRGYNKGHEIGFLNSKAFVQVVTEEQNTPEF